MKFRLFLSAIAISLASFSFGQDDMNSSDAELEQKAMELTEEMPTYLELSDTQVERFKVLNLNFMKKKEALMAAEMSDEVRMEKVAKFEERHIATLKQILNEEQFEKFNSKYSSKKQSAKKK